VQAYRGYAKETFDRALSATRKRHAHRLVNEQATNVRNEGRISVRNESLELKVSDAKWLDTKPKYWLRTQSSANRSRAEIPWRMTRGRNRVGS
jgi:hypothetical protein